MSQFPSLLDPGRKEVVKELWDLPTIYLGLAVDILVRHVQLRCVHCSSNYFEGKCPDQAGTEACLGMLGYKGLQGLEPSSFTASQ